MLFNSLQYLVFLPAVVLLYFATPQRFRWVLLLVASYYFYMAWKVEYALLIALSTLVDYCAALAMGRCETRRQRRKWLLLSLTANLGLLFAFKYLGFATASLGGLTELLGLKVEIPHLELLLPVGISFYTFQTLGYSIDVYRGQQEPQRHLGRFAVFVAFFPQLVAGPIERAGRLLPQFQERHRLDPAGVQAGLQLILWGFFKKLVIADQAALYVDAVYADPSSHGGLTLLVAAYLFAFQIYCDFSGYSDIAVGSARLMGFRLMENFRRPYFSRTIREVWQRWHISLSTWFRDYVYVSLEGNRGSTFHRAWTLMAVFVVSGLWHGANWTFLAWGALHGFYMLVGAVLIGPRRRWLARLPRAVRSLHRAAAVVVTFHLWVLSLVLFRSRSIAQAWEFVQVGASHFALGTEALLGTFTRTEFVATTAPIVLLMLLELWQGERTWVAFLQRRSGLFRAILYVVLFFAIVTLGPMNSQEFIYFQF